MKTKHPRYLALKHPPSIAAFMTTKAEAFEEVRETHAPQLAEHDLTEMHDIPRVRCSGAE